MPELNQWLPGFVAESNRIEGIHRDPSADEIEAHSWFLQHRRPSMTELEQFVKTVAGASLRRHSNMDVTVGKHRPPRGGPEVESELSDILHGLHNGQRPRPWHRHHEYETLHPFMDGNGRSGRVLWAWEMLKAGDTAFTVRGFLHEFYYQTLEHGGKR